MPFLLARKMIYWYRKHGVANIIRLVSLRLWWRVFQNAEALFSVDASDLEESSCVPRPDIAVERYGAEDQIPPEDLDQLAAFKGGKEIFHNHLKKFFSRGAAFWVVKLNGEPAGYRWTIRGGFEGFYKFPMTSKDAVLVAGEVLPPYRGKGVNPAMVQQMLFRLKKDGITRMYVACKVWNEANLRSIPKTSFRRLATVSEAGLFGRKITIWKPPFSRPES